MRWAGIAVGLLVAAPLHAQANGGGGTTAAPADEGGKAVDRGGLASRGGRALSGRQTFQSAIRTEIYTPIRTDIYTPVQRPPNTDQPQS